MSEPKADPVPPGTRLTFRKDGGLAFLNSERTDTLQNVEIEIVKEDADVQRGMMWREFMREDRGMLFIMPEMRTQSFWMKNTLIPLDIIFINSNRQIVTIHKNTEPLSLKNVTSSQNAQFVLEMNGGYCDKFGIKKGDFVRWKTE